MKIVSLRYEDIGILSGLFPPFVTEELKFPKVHCYCAISDRDEFPDNTYDVMGAVIFSYNRQKAENSALEIISICVYPEFRNSKVGYSLLKKIDSLIRKFKIQTVRVKIFEPVHNPDSFGFFEKYGFVFSERSEKTFFGSLKELKKVIPETGAGSTLNIIPLEKINNTMFKKYINSVPDYKFEVFPWKKIPSKEYFDRNLSMVLVNEAGTVSGALLFQRITYELILLVSLYGDGFSKESEIIELIKKAREELPTTRKDDIILSITATEKRTKKLMEYFVPDRSMQNYRTGSVSAGVFSEHFI